MFWNCFGRQKDRATRRKGAKASFSQATLHCPHAVLSIQPHPGCQDRHSTVIEGLSVEKSEGVPGGTSQHATLLAQLASQDRLFRNVLNSFSAEVQGPSRNAPQSVVIQVATPPSSWPPSLSCSLRIRTPGPIESLSGEGRRSAAHVPALILEHVPVGNDDPASATLFSFSNSNSRQQPQQSCSSQSSQDQKVGCTQNLHASHSKPALRTTQRAVPAQPGSFEQKQQQHAWYELLVNEAPTLFTLFTQGGTVLMQNSRSLAYYGALGETGLWSVKGRGTHEASRPSSAYWNGLLQGPIVELFALDRDKDLAALLDSIEGHLGPWKCVIRVKSGLGSKSPPGSPPLSSVAQPGPTRATDFAKAYAKSVPEPISKPAGFWDSGISAEDQPHERALHNSEPGGTGGTVKSGTRSLGAPVPPDTDEEVYPTRSWHQSISLGRQAKSKPVVQASANSVWQVTAMQHSTRLQSQLNKRALHPNTSLARRSLGDLAHQQQQQVKSQAQMWWHGGQSVGQQELDLKATEQQQQMLVAQSPFAYMPERPEQAPEHSKQSCRATEDSSHTSRNSSSESSRRSCGAGSSISCTSRTKVSSRNKESSKTEGVRTENDALPACEPLQGTSSHDGQHSTTSRLGCTSNQMGGKHVAGKTSLQDLLGVISSRPFAARSHLRKRSGRGVTKPWAQRSGEAGLEAAQQQSSTGSIGEGEGMANSSTRESFERGSVMSKSGLGPGPLSPKDFVHCPSEVRSKIDSGRISFLRQGQALSSESIEPMLPKQQEKRLDLKDEEEVACYHELVLSPVIEPMTKQPLLLLIQRDVTEYVEREQMLTELTEGQLTMLSQIFPRHVIDALSSDGAITVENISNLAYNHTDVTILFLDIVGFTSMSKSVLAEEVIVFLNLLFSRFDRLVNKYQVQKIDVIGDAYLVASGVLCPDEDGFWAVDEHHDPALGAGKVLALALEMQHAVLDVLMPDGQPLDIRVGIHTGPCVSGLVGLDVPVWSVFGDTVNTAARMEQTTLPQTIQVSSITRSLLPEDLDLEIRPSGGIPVKGKGIMDTWIWRQPDSWASSTEAPPSLPEFCQRFYEQLCSASSHPLSAIVPGSVLLPKVLQASMKVNGQAIPKGDEEDRQSSILAAKFNRSRANSLCRKARPLHRRTTTNRAISRTKKESDSDRDISSSSSSSNSSGGAKGGRHIQFASDVQTQMIKSRFPGQAKDACGSQAFSSTALLLHGKQSTGGSSRWFDMPRASNTQQANPSSILSTSPVCDLMDLTRHSNPSGLGPFSAICPAVSLRSPQNAIRPIQQEHASLLEAELKSWGGGKTSHSNLHCTLGSNCQDEESKELLHSEINT